MERPAAGGTSGPWKADRLGGSISSKNSLPYEILQRRTAIRLARRFGLSVSLAALVVELAGLGVRA